MRTLLLAGASLLALAASVATASATPVPFSDTTVGSTTFTAPNAGAYTITAIGAQGGSSGGGDVGGFGEQVSGLFTLTAGEMLTIAVGGAGAFGGGGSSSIGGGGGGGSFVVGPGNAMLVIGGGGGGGGGNRSGPGNGGNAAAGPAGGAGSGGSGGFNAAGSNGGFNGGSGGGGGSFDSGLTPLFSLATAGGNGSVVITELTPTTVPEPASLALLGTGVAGLLALRRRPRG